MPLLYRKLPRRSVNTICWSPNTDAQPVLRPWLRSKFTPSDSPHLRMNSPTPASNLPYADVKAVGAADFYFAINTTFRFVLQRFGMAGLRRYWTDLGTQYFSPVSDAWKRRGLDGVAAYWAAFFAAEPGAEVAVTTTGDSVEVEVKVCPAIRHLRLNQRQIVPCFCQHCYHLGEAMAEPAGLTVRIEGGNGSCRQRFCRRRADLAPQDFSQIKEATC